MSIDIPSLLMGKALGSGGGGGGGDEPKLPDEYQRVEYLDFTPNAGFEVAIPSAALWEIICASDTTDSGPVIFGKKQSYSSATAGDFYFNITQVNGVQSFVPYAKSGTVLHEDYPAVVVGQKITFRTAFTNTVDSAWIGMKVNRAGYYDGWDGKFFGLKGWDNLSQELLADFVPCYKKADNTVGIYDTVAKVFYGTPVIAGSGAVAKGPDVN